MEYPKIEQVGDNAYVVHLSEDKVIMAMDASPDSQSLDLHTASLIAQSQRMYDMLKRLLPFVRGITIGEVFAKGRDAIHTFGLDPWCLKEGRADPEDKAPANFLIDLIDAIEAPRVEGEEPQEFVDFNVV